MWWARLPILLLAGVLFAGGAFRVSTTDGNVDGYALMAVALVLVGVWVTIDLHDRWHK